MLAIIANHLDEISVEELHDALDNVDGTKPTQRLLTAIAYKNGLTQNELAEWHGVQRRTIYSWLKRLDTDEPLSKPLLMISELEGSKSFQSNSKKHSKNPFTTHRARSASTRRRGHRRSSSSSSKKPTAWGTQSRVAGGC